MVFKSKLLPAAIRSQNKHSFIAQSFNETTEPKNVRSSNTNTTLSLLHPNFQGSTFKAAGIMEQIMTRVTNLSAEASSILIHDCQLEGGKFGLSI